MLTPDQMAKARGDTSPLSGGTPPSSAMTPEQAHAWINGTTPPPEAAPSFTDRVGADISTAGDAVHSAIAGEGKYSGETPLRRGVEAVATASSVPLRVATEALPKPARDVLDTVSKTAGSVVQWLGDKIGSTEAAQNFVKNHPDAANALAEAAGIGQAGGEIAGNILAADQVAKGVQKTVDITKETLPYVKDEISRIAHPPTPADAAREIQNHMTSAQQIKEGVPGVSNSDLIADTHKNIVQGLKGEGMAEQSEAIAKLDPKDYATLEEYGKAVKDATNPMTPQINKVASTWQEPTSMPGARFNKAAKVLEKSPDTPKFLAEQGLDPNAHIEDGKFVTLDSAQALRDTAGKMSRDTLRPSLQMADYSTPKTLTEELKGPSVDYLEKSFSVTADDAEAIAAQIDKKITALQHKYPEGMSLTDMHDEKITYAQNGGFSPVKDPAVTNNAIANRAISDTLGTMVEKKAPEGVPVADFNSYLGKYYKGADYLEALNTKIAPTSLAKDVARFASKYGGAALGAHLGGGVVSAFAGYSIGKAIEHALENLSGSARSKFLSNLEVTNPEAFTQVQSYLAEQNAGGGLLRLPAATSETPIPLGPDSTVTPEPVAPYAAKNPLPSFDPKTGRGMRVFNSSPQ